MKLSNQEKRELYKKLLIACKSGDSSFIKQIIDSGLDNQINEPTPSKMIEHASGYGHVEIIKIMFTSEHLKKYIDNETTLKNSVDKAFLHGRIEVVKFLATKLERFGEDYNDKIISTGICDAVMNGKLEMVKFLIETPPIKTNLNTDFFIEKAIDLGAIYNRVDILKYTIEKDKFEYFKKDQDNLYNTFWGALINGSMDAIKYFIFDLKIEKTENIEKLLSNKRAPDYELVSNLFEIREINKELREELPSLKNEENKKPKL